MNIYISVVSHGHDKIIKKLKCIENLSNFYNVIIKSNKSGDDFNDINNAIWINDNYGLGFGENNNYIFNYCRTNLAMTDDDIFIVLNPDIDICVENINKLISIMNEKSIMVAAINLFKDESYTIFDNSIRYFPTFSVFVKSFLGKVNSSILDKSRINNLCAVDWAAGSFLAFKVGHYQKLKGFDENYFMYCEDIDICYRSKLISEPVIYIPVVRAVHLAKHANRKILSKHFYWHIKSVVTFLLKTKVNIKSKSSIK